MSGTILERLSGKKLAIICLILFTVQVICFLIGGLIAPSPTNVQQILATICIDKNDTFNEKHKNTFLFLRPADISNCFSFDLNDFDNELELSNFAKQHNLSANKVVFVFQIPLPKDRTELDMSRWFNSMLTLLMIDIEYKKHIELSTDSLRIEAKLGYRNKKDPFDQWTLISHSHHDRHLNCHIEPNMKIDGYYYNCSALPFFELGNVYHDFYLVNLRIPTYPGNNNINAGLGKIKDIWLVEIHQNGGFTRVWFSLKIFWFPIILALTYWYWRRVRLATYPCTTKPFKKPSNEINIVSNEYHNLNDQEEEEGGQNVCFSSNSSNGHHKQRGYHHSYAERPISLLEYAILTLALGISFLNLPVDIFVLWFDMPYMLFYSDIRQGIFYAFLFIFWIIFCGEHLIDDVPRNHLSAYWKQLSGVGAACILLFVFELCERGIELKDPFFSIWATRSGTKLAVAILALSCICLTFYLTLLCYMISSVFKNISKKRLTLPAMKKSIKLKYEGIIYRFKFLMVATVICAALTVTYFLISHVSENHWKWQEEEGFHMVGEGSKGNRFFPSHGLLPNLQYTSAFYTGVYGMWNLYVIAILIFYAPSHKTKPDGLKEESECLRIESCSNQWSLNGHLDSADIMQSNEPTALTSFLTKENID